MNILFGSSMSSLIISNSTMVTLLAVLPLLMLVFLFLWCVLKVHVNFLDVDVTNFFEISVAGNHPRAWPRTSKSVPAICDWGASLTSRRFCIPQSEVNYCSKGQYQWTTLLISEYIFLRIIWHLLPLSIFYSTLATRRTWTYRVWWLVQTILSCHHTHRK